ncbi:sulfotransferase family 2 domain-containing protein [Faunimonas sp. B44]|uniref:sulfotransferase family 2 domain-containing protein n=1 Tax=Faunimonas sp. B44 TaxID=3461493 RepID=UPI004045117D
MISHAHRCIFIHIPKCAGTSVETTLWTPQEKTEDNLWGGSKGMHNKYQTGGMQHLTARNIRKHVGDETFYSYFKFSFVRNPFDKAVSQYHYMSTRPDLRSYVGLRRDAGFEEYLERIRLKEHVQWQRQTDFVCDDDGSLIVDFLGRVESFASDLGQILAVLGVECGRVPHENRSDRSTDYRAYYDSGTREMVSEMYMTDLMNFGYEF